MVGIQGKVLGRGLTLRASPRRHHYALLVQEQYLHKVIMKGVVQWDGQQRPENLNSAERIRQANVTWRRK